MYDCRDKAATNASLGIYNMAFLVGNDSLGCIFCIPANCWDNWYFDLVIVHGKKIQAVPQRAIQLDPDYLAVRPLKYSRNPMTFVNGESTVCFGKAYSARECNDPIFYLSFEASEMFDQNFSSVGH